MTGDSSGVGMIRRGRTPPPIVRVLAAAVCLAILGGCVRVESGNGDPGNGQVRATDDVVFDLREPFTRNVAGLEPGQRYLPRHADPGEVIRARVILPDNSEFTIDAATVTIVSEGTNQDDQPSVIYLRRPAEPLPDAYEHLLQAADRLELDRAEIEGWHSEAITILDGSAPLGSTHSTRVWYRNEPIDEIHLGVQAITSGGSMQNVTVLYMVELHDLLATFD